jgi:hypothetical protein
LSVGEILDRTFTLYRRNFLLFFGITAIPYMLNLVLNLVRLLYFRDFTSAGIKGAGATATLSGSYFLMMLIAAAVGLVVYLFSQGATILAVTELYLGRTTSMASALGRVWDELGTLFGVVVLNGLAVGVGLILLVIPGLYMMCRLLVCVPAALVENLGPRESLSRSFDLTRDNAGRAFLLFLVYMCLVFAGGTLTGLLLLPVAVSHQDPSVMRLWGSLSLVAQTLINSLVSPIFLIACAVFYFDLRIRKEAFDLQFMMNPDSEHVTRTRAPGSIL